MLVGTPDLEVNIIIIINFNLQVLVGTPDLEVNIIIIINFNLQVLVGTPDLEVNIDTIEQQGYTWPIPKDALLTYKHLTQDPELLFLSPSLLGANHTNYTVGVRVKVIATSVYSNYRIHFHINTI